MGKILRAGGENACMFKWIVIGGVVLVLLASAGGTAVIASARDLPGRALDAVRGNDGGQSGAQLSPREYLTMQRGWTRERVRGFVGEPEATSSARVEGVTLECWSYGIAGGTGVFQLCFVDGRLESRFRYG